MQRDAAFANGEYYHIFNRGAHRLDIFRRDEDYKRFLLLLHVGNTAQRVDLRAILRKYKGQTFANVLEGETPDKSLVDISAYCLMPNHFHLVIKQKTDKGITAFLRKVLTAYSMYFNLVHGHSGVLSQGAFKSRHINSEPYFRYIFSYVHLNPLALLLPDWEENGIKEHLVARSFLAGYSYSSFYDYSIKARPETKILAFEEAPTFLTTQNDLEELLRWYDKGQTFVEGVV